MPPTAPATPRSQLEGALLRHEMLLLYVLVAEWLFFYFAGTTNRRGVTVGFGTLDRQFDILRHSCEIGLLALALTPVIITAGIDLSVGSLLGLCAILFGKLWRDAGCRSRSPPASRSSSAPLAAGSTPRSSPPCGCRRSSSRSARIRCFRGLAEAITRGSITYTDFPRAFSFSARNAGSACRCRPGCSPWSPLAVWLLVHRTSHGRSFRAIGFSPEGARYAGLPVDAAPRPGLCAGRPHRRPRRAHLHGAPRPGQGRRRHRLRTLRHHRRRARRHEHLRRQVGSVHRHPARRRAIAVLKNGLATLPVVMR
jgi:hypothetical protein